MAPTEKKISIKFKHFNQNIKDVWDNYNILTQYIPTLHDLVKSEAIEPFKVIGLSTKEQVHKKPQVNTYGILNRLRLKNVPEKSLTDGVALTEDYIKEITGMVYTDYPGRLGGKDNDEGREEKLLAIITSSADKEEIIDRIIEERLRSIFYGNPAEVFTKDKCKIGFGDYFSKHYSSLIDKYIEITATRNILTHNDGRVDRKYLREVRGTSKKIDEKIKISGDYLRDSLICLRGLAAIFTYLVQDRIYHSVKIGGVVEKYYKIFEMTEKK